MSMTPPADVGHMPAPLSYAQAQWAHTSAQPRPGRFAPRKRPKPAVAPPTPSENVDGELLAPAAYTADAKVRGAQQELTKALLDIRA